MGERFSFKNDFYFGWNIDRFWMLCYSKDDNINVQTILKYIHTYFHIYKLKMHSSNPLHIILYHISNFMHELVLLFDVFICMCV